MAADDKPIDPAVAAQVRTANAKLDEARRLAMPGRAALAQRIRDNMPPELAGRVQWLLWRFEVQADRPASLRKPLKVPYYAGGGKRWKEIGGERDRSHLATLDLALQRWQQSARWDGIGLTFLPDDGLIGIDLDHAVDPTTGQPSDLCRLTVEAMASYTELSPSGLGVHIIVAGACETFKDDRLGVEVYQGGRYFTWTGDRCSGGAWPETPVQVRPADDTMLAYLREQVMASREVQRQEREARSAAAAAAVQAPAPTVDASPAAAPPAPAPQPAPKPPAAAPSAQAQPAPAGGDDFKRVNDAAMAALHDWVPALFSDAKGSGAAGYRITSKQLGRDLEEDLSIKPDGIVDFGVADMGDARQGKRTPIDLVLEWGSRVGVSTTKPADAMRWLAKVLGLVVAEPRRPQLRAVPAGRQAGRVEGARAPKPGQGGGAADGDAATAGPLGDDPPDDDDGLGDDGAADGGHDGGPGSASEGGSGGGKGGRGKRKAHSPEVWAQVDMLCQRFALIYGTDTAWDLTKRLQLKITAMRYAFDKLPVNLWLTRPDRLTVDWEDIQFEPGRMLTLPLINTYQGLELQPVPCEPADVDPMLQLLRHLCSDTKMAGSERPVDDVMHWVLCWQALPVQQPGTKMATAVVMHGAQGTGKNLYWDAWRDIFGKHGITVTQTELEDKFNGWVSHKMAIVGDEVVSRQEMYHNKNRLKLVVTQREKFAIRGMHQEVRWETNCANVVFLSNESEPLVLEERDRRYAVIYTPLEAPEELYRKVTAFMADGGLGKWLYYLLNYDLGDFGAHTKPLMTQAKQDLIEAGWRPATRFIAEWIGGLLDLPLRPCSVEQAYRAFRRWCDKTGARWPPEQAKFTAEINRWVKERQRRGPDGRIPEPDLEYKVVGLVQPGAVRRSVRCLIPRGCQDPQAVPDDDQRTPRGIGEWMGECVEAFEQDLYRFMRRPGQFEGGDE